VTANVSGTGLIVVLPGSAPDPDVSVAALDFTGPVQVSSAATSPMDNGGAGTPADPSGATTQQ